MSKDKFFRLIDNLFNRFKNNDGIKERFHNEKIYHELLNSLEVLYINRSKANDAEALGFKNNLDYIIDTLESLSTLTEDLASISTNNVQVVQNANKLIYAIEELFPKDKNNNIIKDEQVVKKTEKPLTIKENHQKLEDEILKLQGSYSRLEEEYQDIKKDYIYVKTLKEEASNAKNEFTQAKEAVLQKIISSESTDFWENQAKKYKDNFNRYFGLSILIALVLIVVMFGSLDIFNLQVNENNNTMDINNTFASITNSIKTLSFAGYLFYILSTTLVVWFMKIIIKIALSNYHLYIDATERVTMIKTYLALLEEGTGYEKNDKKVMLNNIFRPTNHGIIKDETSVTVADIISSFRK
jgi:hypothetical protein